MRKVIGQMTKKSISLLDDFLSSGVDVFQLDSSSLRQIRLINLVNVWVAVTSMLVIGVNFFVEAPYLSPTLMLTLLVSIVDIILLRMTHNIQFCGQVILINVFITILIGELLIGGAHSPILPWIFIVPVLAFVILDGYFLFYNLITLGFIALSYYLDSAGLLPLTMLSEQILSWLQYVSASLELFLLFACLYNYHQEKINYERLLESSNIRLQHMRDKYYLMAHKDELTNLANRTEFYHQINNVRTTHTDTERVSIIYIDLDKMKRINDTYGHDAGDTALYYLGKRLQRSFRANDVVARLGGDEFAAMIVDENAPEVAERIAKKLVNFSKRPIKFNDEMIHITLSVGIATFPDDGQVLDEVIVKADKALYAVKKKGGNNYSFYTKNGAHKQNIAE